MIFISFLLFIPGFCEGIMDTLQFHFHESVFSKINNRYYWDPEISWKNKYLNGDPLSGPRFPLSTTFLVSFTDGWHTFKLIRNIFIFASLPIIGYFSCNIGQLIILIILSRTIYGMGFWIAYYKLLKLKK